MKKLLKENLKLFIVVIVTGIVTSITSIFAYSLIAENVGYTPKDTTWNVENVEAALNNLNLRENQLSTHYSTEEQVVGEWIDGKPIYQKTWNNLSIKLHKTQWVDAISVTNLDRVINATLMKGTKYFCAPDVYNENENIKVFDGDFADVTFDILTIQYTKTTD